MMSKAILFRCALVVAGSTLLTGCDLLWAKFAEWTGLDYRSADQACVILFPAQVYSSGLHQPWPESYESEFSNAFYEAIHVRLDNLAIGADGPPRIQLKRPTETSRPDFCGKNKGYVDPTAQYEQCIVYWGRTVVKSLQSNNVCRDRTATFSAGVKVEYFPGEAGNILAVLRRTSDSLGPTKQVPSVSVTRFKNKVDLPYVTEVAKFAGITIADAIHKEFEKDKQGQPSR